MKIFYLVNVRMPTEKAHGAAIMKACEALVAGGEQVELVVPRRYTGISEDPFVYYGVATRFPIRRLFTVDTVSWGRVGFWLESIAFAIAAARYLRVHTGSLVYGRDELVLWVISHFVRMPVVWESHDGAWNWFARKVSTRATGLVVVTQGAKRAYEERGVPGEKILAVSNGVDLTRYEEALTMTPEEARAQLGLPHDKKIAVYSGHLHTWKGADTLAQAAELLPHNFLLLFMGGTDKDIATFREKYDTDERIMIVGRKNERERPLYLRAADVAVLPNTGKSDISSTYTSPLKLFGYMAAEVPIVASDLPSVREVVGEQEAFFAVPDNPRSFADTLTRVAADSEAARAKARAARKAVEKYTWRHRASHIVGFLHARTNL